MTIIETEVLVVEMSALADYQGWHFTYEYPGFFCYTNPETLYSVWFTPDWAGDQKLVIEVQIDGCPVEEHSSGELSFARDWRTAQQLFDLVRPTLDKLLLAVVNAD